ncbi:hypothetical protein [Hoeflea olei]|uniref:Uncharacterized protein n=1 Tax=Hoeflea olei TaxID=1480615 RepID=A0A1C1YSC6_9HYPH|nr:hypothetical protein [Hoeflea olei]OCW56257.1 hypothetical protein AWJ14_19375 [Hoeflea olei]
MSDARIGEVRQALLVLGAVAAEDADYAKTRNGRGFSKSDSSKGHALSKVSLAAALGDQSLLGEILRMAARYRRQASTLSQGTLL